MQKITPFLWFDDKAEEAAAFYVSIFENSKITHINHYGDAGAKAAGRPKGSVMTVSFKLDGQAFVALNGGPHFSFSPAISFVVNCESQAELNELWARLSAGGEEEHCGWLQDKYGVSWQLVPARLGDLLPDDDPEKAEKVMTALLRMDKLDIEALRRAGGD